MPRIRLEDIRDDSQELIEHSVEVVGKGASWMWHGFREWVLQDNILEVAVGLM